MATEITAPLHFKTLLSSHTYLIADFYATWCPPCKMIAPIYNELATANSSLGKFAFVKINVDEQNEIAAQYNVRAMPTFLLFKNGQKVEEVMGAVAGKIKAVVENASIDIKSENVNAAQSVLSESVDTPSLGNKQD